MQSKANQKQTKPERSSNSNSNSKAKQGEVRAIKLFEIHAYSKIAASK